MTKTVLVVDDFVSTRKVIGSSLSRMGYSILDAENGEDAKKFFDGRTIHLLITDLNMPVSNGVELTRYVRNSNTYYKLPILLLTTEIKKEKKSEALEAGVTAILNKPYSATDFKNIIERLLR